ncbi:hypothetical protein B0A49_01523 [Cryomyces minteri]|uniref:SAGA-associated factor 11 n=1 Tax=Cryomyces minteri TaxID=331657 RepID=A0A4V5NET4_9PEZI|nr:hypothetical protein B0A49_09280 [Cryomyces minteri]TKA81012.1 hypothetical protein B0A49_01523 [Cryomyces minteri]
MTIISDTADTMSEEEDAGSKTSPSNSSDKLQISESSLASLTSSILSDCLHNIIHDLVLSHHRTSRLERASSAATLASLSSDGQSTPATSHNQIFCPHCRLPRLLTTQSVPDPGKAYCTRHPFSSRPGHDIYGNPFPTGDPGAKTSSSGSKKEKPGQSQPQSQTRKDGTPASEGAPTSPSSSRDAASNINSLNGMNGTTGTTAKISSKLRDGSYIPWHTCPKCKRSLLITRFVVHLEKCLGVGGRHSARSAATGTAVTAPAAGGKLNGSASGNGNGRGTPGVASRADTPLSQTQSQAQAERGDDADADGDADGEVEKESNTYTGTATGTGTECTASVDDNDAPKKKLKRVLKKGVDGLKERERERERDRHAGNSTNGTVAPRTGRPPKPASRIPPIAASPDAPSTAADRDKANLKRGRERTKSSTDASAAGEAGVLRKKQRLQRTSEDGVQGDEGNEEGDEDEAAG